MSQGYEAPSYQGYASALDAESMAQELEEQLARESQDLFYSRIRKMSKAEIDNINKILDKVVRNESLSPTEQSTLVDYISPLASVLRISTPLTQEDIQKAYLEGQIRQANAELKELMKTYKDQYGMDLQLEQ
jgi:hypothetical protein